MCLALADSYWFLPVTGTDQNECHPPPPPARHSEATSQACLMPRLLLATIINSFTVDSCQGWTRPWLSQLPGLYFLPYHMGTGTVIGEKKGGEGEAVCD